MLESYFMLILVLPVKIIAPPRVDVLTDSIISILFTDIVLSSVFELAWWIVPAVIDNLFFPLNYSHTVVVQFLYLIDYGPL